MKYSKSLVLLIVFSFPACAFASDAIQAPPQLPRVALMEVLDSASKTTKMRFVVNEHAAPSIVIGQVNPRKLTYAELLIILKNNDLAAVKVDDLVNIVPVKTVRQHALPTVQGFSDALADEEWVSMLVLIKNIPATQLVPIMRPLLPQAGHLAANPASNTIMLVDRYGNAKRVARMIAEMDAKAAAIARAD
ncbi:MAG: hypothetical protein HKN77_09905 [Woeseiaceae bacterium]|nr:hypothetical protein [Woeseiaceae bacterium]